MAINLEIRSLTRSGFSPAVLLIRTYAFFSRNIYVLCFLLSALSGVVAYQLYVDTTQMLRRTLSRLMYPPI